MLLVSGLVFVGIAELIVGQWAAGLFLAGLGGAVFHLGGRAPAVVGKNRVKTMVFISQGTGKGIRYPEGGGFRSSEKIRWIASDDTTFFREPVEEKREYIKGLPFIAGGKHYIGFGQLCCRQPDGTTKDAYGRRTVCFQERFPCFDSYDYLYENRYYRWAFICCDGKLTRVYFRDEGKRVYVTEDVEELETDFWSAFRKLGLAVDPPET